MSQVQVCSLAALDAHGMRPVGDAYDFCLLDATHYDAEHHEDLCVLQARVGL
ncbi:hypothetical protein QJ043_03090 [Olsenella sp. YH-ols2217]|uniref:Uncharacterized protein n=1 Tax=Kribbibacterium absianum TaxID=3044210 RepID=A0ABT6ZK91_9ACTN|nr:MULTISPECIES: hypothetical protein [unclassified Olsenella]MDJ1122633.1 hypothetical protein [Olsenella sp. YH-ols2216]MDJ1129071.1 hypothetical protein [Olsenella sp. YH-ols2217]